MSKNNALVLWHAKNWQDEPLTVAPPRLSASALEVWQKAKKVGWAVVYCQADPGQISWAYTVGLQEHFNHPEILISGLSQPIAVSILNAVGTAIKRGKKFNEKAGPIEGILKQRSVIFAPLNPRETQKFCKMAEVFYPLWELDVLELLWPDAQGTFQWEEGFLEKSTQKQLHLSSKNSV